MPGVWRAWEGKEEGRELKGQGYGQGLAGGKSGYGGEKRYCGDRSGCKWGRLMVVGTDGGAGRRKSPKCWVVVSEELEKERVCERKLGVRMV